MADAKPLLGLVFPHHLGPTFKAFAVPLIYQGGLTVSMPGWISPEVLDWYERVKVAAQATQSPLMPLLAFTDKALWRAQEDAATWLPVTKALGDRVTRSLVVYPGTPDSYVFSQELFARSPQLAAAALQDDHGKTIAATELIWRIFELALLLDSADDVVTTLEERAAALPDVAALLGECYLHRYSFACHAKEGLSLVTDSLLALTVFAHAGEDLAADDDDRSVAIEHIKYTLFDAVLGDYVGEVSDVARAKRLATLLDERSSELERFKKAVGACAAELASASDDQREAAFKDTLTTVGAAAKEVAELDTHQRGRIVELLTEDRSLWATVAGLLGHALGSLPAVVPATLAVTSFASLGTSALRARRERKRLLQKSPYSFVYYAKRGH